MAEVIEAEATVIEADITPLGGLDVLMGEIAGGAERIAAQYGPHDIKDGDDYRQSKRERTAARKEIAALKARYDERMGAIKRAVKDADARMKSAIGPLDAIDKGYKAKLDAWDATCVNRRLATLREAYEDLAPDIALPLEGADAPLVPFERVLGRYGNEKGEAWTSLARGAEAKALRSLEAAVADIATGERTIESMVEEAYREGARARYFRTLDLQATLAEEAEAKAQRERIERLERERQERMAAMAKEEAEQPVPQPMPAPTPQPVPTPAPVAPPQVVAAPQPNDPPRPWVVTVPRATRAQMVRLSQLMKAEGIVYDRIYSGDMDAAYSKWERGE